MIWVKASRLFILTLVVIYLCKYFLRKDFLRDYPYYDLETNYLHWSSKLPAISVCQKFKNNRSLNGGRGDFLKNLLNPTKVYCRGCDKGRKLEGEYETPSAIVDKLVLPCEKLLTKCKWNKQKFTCCNRFKRLITPKGICYSANSEVVSTSERFEVSFYTKRAELDLEFSEMSKVYLHDVKEINPRQGILVKTGEMLDILYTIRETKADEMTRQIDFELRNCILQGELGPRVYSKSICSSHCLAKAQIKHCNCTHHFVQSFVQGQNCDFKGLICLDENSSKIKGEMASFCGCSEACDEILPTIIWAKKTRIGGERGKANIVLSSPPTERLIMKSKTNNLERLVTIACISRWLTNYSFTDLAKIIMNKLFNRVNRHMSNSILY